MTTHRLGPAEASRLRQVADQLLDVLARLVPLARSVGRGVRVLGWSTLAAAALLVAAAVLVGGPDQVTWFGLGLMIALTILVGALLLLLHGALVEAVAIPQLLRQLPDVASAHATELGALVGEARLREARVRRGFMADVFRAGRLLLRAHDDLPGYGSALRLVSWPFLLAAAVAAVLAPFIVLLDLVLVILIAAL